MTIFLSHTKTVLSFDVKQPGSGRLLAPKNDREWRRRCLKCFGKLLQWFSKSSLYDVCELAANARISSVDERVIGYWRCGWWYELDKSSDCFMVCVDLYFGCYLSHKWNDYVDRYILVILVCWSLFCVKVVMPLL